ncbi:ABC transporter permease [Thiomicrospira microaerophila]|uniref:ABC transporter permease n=1 Tax=Thiomicrospira microaerophila TaxID=406020 RepID=UPI000698AD64|nr:ABC transporter permease [Thiomicrospira microaerophila]
MKLPVFLEPYVALVKGVNPKDNATLIFRQLGLPVVGLLVFMMVWSGAAKNIETSLGNFPGPVEVYNQFTNLVDEHQAEKEKAQAFFERQQARNEARMAQDPDFVSTIRPYTGAPTFFDQIKTSLFTVFTAFVIGSLIAIPIGILIGMSDGLYRAVNPIIQLFKPVSPLAWLPLVTLVVSALYISESPMFQTAFIVSAITVLLSSIWSTIINTAVGVATVSKDLLNVSKVLNLNAWTHVTKILIPSAIPMIFTGLRISLGIAWMVLIAAEMLSQSPGLGKFIWDQFQNGSSESMSRIMVAVLVIGLIGFFLDRLMLLLQKTVSWDKSAVLR